MLEHENKRQLYFWISISSLLVVIGVVLYFSIRKRFLRIYRKRLKVNIEKALNTIKENERIIGQYICQIEDLRLKENVAEQEMDSLNQKIYELKIENEQSAKEQIAKLKQKFKY